MNFEIRSPATKSEFESYYDLRWQILRAPWQQPKGSEVDELESQSIHRMVVDEQGDVLAVGRLHKADQHSSQIRYMAVAEKAQGMGLGKQVLNALVDVAKQQGVTEIQLNAREQALTFYEKLGFENLGKGHLLYGEIQHYSMRISLTPASKFPELTRDLQSTWHSTIPLSKAMNIEIASFDETQLTTSADLLFNKNLHNTMFAGSIYTLATLTGWGWVHLALAREGLAGDIVLADGHIRYHKPVEGVGTAMVLAENVKDNLAVLEKGKKPRFTIEVSVLNGEEVAATFTGLYVVIPTPNKES